ncbi:protein kinase family protein [Aeribacillus sp. FSL K6-1121]|jgi:serine/threonine-protein kinase|uniref:protein kinase domain-containing protein n=1 Tax=Aeribacillus sp. FSL K6-1121 TaxID=2954745 RepID=UPI0030FC2691
MMNTSMNKACKVLPGTIIKGKWHGNTYRILKMLGCGATGSVYLIESSKGYAALKISENSMGITSEVNVLKRLAKVQGSCLGPSLIDVDDWFNTASGKMLPFYVMEYVKGEHFIQFIKNNGAIWIDVLILQLLSNLEELHQSGWVFGDLKPDNLIVTGPPPKIRCIDVGGTTINGRSIKEFTEFFDRGYWELGTRKAEPKYDLFAVGMIIINAVFQKRFSKKGNSKEQLIQIINSHPFLNERKQVLTKALFGSYSSALEMKQDLLHHVSNANLQRKRNVQAQSKPKRTANNRKRKKKKSKGLIETLVIMVCLAFLYSLYIFATLL